jgi:hypothetical protein
MQLSAMIKISIGFFIAAIRILAWSRDFWAAEAKIGVVG